ncbi:pantetheine-phosphate adenylyltransferase [Geoglobus acetivorans]|uniref:Phosphopantetheine adenylyltransferase n=1 Tax=Geoglobus acetivorans TaxID=565033 RepID=A0ABZ3H1N0_GEOAI|nr:phosphopantetheine adenylyltransferase [Geoglobus acetivorans]
MKRFRVAVGGTFEPLHEGHKRLIDKAVELGGEDITIGVTSDKMARQRIRSVLPFVIRAENVRWYVRRKYGFDPHVVEITTPYGKTLDYDFEYLVVSPETCEMAKIINEKRREMGKSEIKIVRVDFVLADDDKPISATRIKKGIIDRYGRLI